MECITCFRVHYFCCFHSRTFPYIIRISTLSAPTAKMSCRQKGTILLFSFHEKEFYNSPSYIMRVPTHRLLILSLNHIKAFARGNFHHQAPRWPSSSCSWSSSPSALSPWSPPPPSPPTPVGRPRTLVR